jgi:uracil-DNA glycosylase family 4
MSMENLRKKIEKCKACGKNRFWYFPEYNGVKGFLGEKTYIFVCSQPHEGSFRPESIVGDKCLYQCMKKYRFSNSHLTDLVKCRGPKGKELKKTEIDNCNKWLRKEIEIVNPKAIIAVGKKSYSGLMQEEDIRPVIMINHYSTAMYDKEYEREFEVLREYLNAGKIRHGTKIPELIKEQDHQQVIHTVEQSLQSKYLSEIDRLRKTEVITQKDFFELRDKWTEDYAEFLMQKLKNIEKTHLSQK